MNFDSERQVIEKEHAFNSENRVCFKCHKRGHVLKQCRENLGSRRDVKTKLEKFSTMSARSLNILQNIARQRKSSLVRLNENSRT